MKASYNKARKKEYDRVYKAAEWADPDRRAILKARHKAWKESPAGVAWIKEYNRQYRIKNKEKLTAYDIEYKKKKFNTDPIFKKNHMWKDNLRRVLRRRGADRDASMQKLCGCSFDFFIKHIEEQFYDEMNWSNRGNNGWCIDHIRPKSTFDLRDIEQWDLCCSWRNLQPIWHFENSIKGSKFNYDDELDWINIMQKYKYKGELFLKWRH